MPARIVYDSRDPACKRPFGAVEAGATVQFSIHLPKIHLTADPVIKLFEMDRWDHPITIPMQFQSADYLHCTFGCAFTPPSPCLYAYYFEVPADDQLYSVRRGADGTGTLQGDGTPWQLTVYDGGMKSPACLREGVIYQIFPDRFCNSGTPKSAVPSDRVLRGDWGALPAWRPNEQGKMVNNDYFGGDLKGIEQQLPYLQSLGITAIYLNPIFEAHCNHRYNTANYLKIDPLLGNEDDLRCLCAAAKQCGISIFLDGVFSHTGSDSIYFNKEGRYGETGAYRDPQSPYREWYQFTEYPHCYESWWGFETLPNVREETPSYLEFICGQNGVLRHWLRNGVSGFRLDVADELPDIFLDRLRECVKGYSGDCAVLGEVWEDASNKESYGVRRRYLLGKQLDSVMNYPFREAILGYIRWGHAQTLYNTVMQILENYPRPAIQSLMNSLSTHDTPRAITELVGEPLEQHDRQWQEGHHYLPIEQYQHGKKLLMLAGILQFGLPGIPCIYYGDEVGLSGYRDPFNRVCYPWGYEDAELLAFFRSLGAVRREYPIFAEAEFLPITFSRDLCAFARCNGSTVILFAVNRSANRQRLLVPTSYHITQVLAQTGEQENLQFGPYSGAVFLATLLPNI